LPFEVSWTALNPSGAKSFDSRDGADVRLVRPESATRDDRAQARRKTRERG